MIGAYTELLAFQQGRGSIRAEPSEFWPGFVVLTIKEPRRPAVKIVVSEVFLREAMKRTAP